MLSKHWGSRSYPVDPYIIAYENNIEIRHNPELQGQSIAGKIYKQGDRVIIEVNPWQTPYRQRFTIAHELGHYFLNHELNGDGLNRTDTVAMLSNPTDKVETQANDFAANLLMPREFIEGILYKLQISDLDQMANMLGVSKLALTYRLKNLRITI